MNSLGLEGIFEIATTRELEANAFYTSVAEKAENPAVRDIFKQFAKDEMGHYELIEKFRTDPAISMKISAPAIDWKVAETETLPKLTTDMKPRDAIALAMKKEQQAAEFYRFLADGASDAEVKRLLLNLRNMELGHKQRLEHVFVDIAYPESF